MNITAKFRASIITKEFYKMPNGNMSKRRRKIKEPYIAVIDITLETDCPLPLGDTYVDNNGFEYIVTRKAIRGLGDISCSLRAKKFHNQVQSFECPNTLKPI